MQKTHGICVKGFVKKNSVEWNFTASVLFNDKTTFSIEGVMNIHNLRIWMYENPHAIRAHKLQHEFILHVKWYFRRLFIFFGIFSYKDSVVAYTGCFATKPTNLRVDNKH